MKNYGLNLGREAKERSETDYIFGAVARPCLAQIPMEERAQYLPKGETQYGVVVSCGILWLAVKGLLPTK